MLLLTLLSSSGQFCSLLSFGQTCARWFSSGPASSEETPLHRPQGSEVKHTEILRSNTLNGYRDQIHAAAAAALLWLKQNQPRRTSVSRLLSPRRASVCAFSSLTMVAALGVPVQADSLMQCTASFLSLPINLKYFLKIKRPYK